MTSARIIGGFSEIADRFDAFLFDQWGVMHDGVAPFEGVIPVIERLCRAGKRCLILSNSGRRRGRSIRRLAELGFDPALFEDVVTSGEVAWQLLKECSEPPFSEFGRRCFLFTRAGDLEVVEGLDLELVEDVDEADFVLISGVDSPERKLEDYLPFLERAARRQLPAVCSNVDLLAPHPEGVLVLAPGTLAQRYRELGGRVESIGKPHARVYRACLERLSGVSRRRVLMVGDSLSHDIRGARNAGIASCLVTAGLHRHELPRDLAAGEFAAALEALGRSHGAMPDYVIDALRW